MCVFYILIIFHSFNLNFIFFRKQSYLWLQGDLYKLRKSQNNTKKKSVDSKSKELKSPGRSSLAIPRERLQPSALRSSGQNCLTLRNSIDNSGDTNDLEVIKYEFFSKKIMLDDLLISVFFLT